MRRDCVLRLYCTICYIDILKYIVRQYFSKRLYTYIFFFIGAVAQNFVLKRKK